MTVTRRTVATASPPAPESSPNRILVELSRTQYQRLLPHLEPVTMELGDILHERGWPVPEVFFMGSGLVSLVLHSQEGIGVEVAVVGREGMVGTETALGVGPTFSQAVVQVAGSGWKLPTARLSEELQREGKLMSLLQTCMRGIVEQAAQNALCNRLHTVDQRLSRWLLLVSDVLESDSFALTQRDLGHMIGARTTGVSAAATTLRLAGMIDYKRGRITILDREAAQLSACECYAALHSHFPPRK